MFHDYKGTNWLNFNKYYPPSPLKEGYCSVQGINNCTKKSPSGDLGVERILPPKITNSIAFEL